MSLSNKAIAEEAGYQVRPRDGEWYWQHRNGETGPRFHTAIEAYDDAARHAFDNKRIAIEAYLFVDGDLGYEMLKLAPTTTYEQLSWKLAELRKTHKNDVRVMRRGVVDITHLLDGRPLE